MVATKLGKKVQVFKSIRAIYNIVKVNVKSLGKLSECFDSLVRVKQGESLSPLLFFILCLIDLTLDLDEFQKFVLLFADDTLLLSA